METGASAGFKLRSRTKIIRTTSPSPSDVRSPGGAKPGPRPRSRPRSGPGRTLVSRHRLRRISPGQTSFRTSPKDLVSVSRHKLRRVKVQTSSESKSRPNKDLVSVSRHKLRRVKVQTSLESKSRPNKDLISVSRHKLRRISPGLSKAHSRTRTRTKPGPGLAPGAGFRSQFKTDKRNVTWPTGPHPSWRRLRLQAPRTLPQGRLHALHTEPPRPGAPGRTAPPGGQPNMCWIRGSLFTVSASKLSRATPPKRSAGSALLSRHRARCVLQRSLSVARASSLKKTERQFCIFFNRFGRCNRGAECRFIHDPEKIAVCSRFLRGRCKDGDNCPFSHKVSKDKMPVCSFFLKGACLNTECPYSHVYVSRKAQVCEDFLRGYCPEGQKCKKKHTLICPDVNCLRGDACKLQHKRPIRRSVAKTPRPLCSRPAGASGPGPGLDPDPGPGPGPGPGPLDPQKLPSFISLCSSPEEADAPPPPGGAVLSKGRSLQIKPRLHQS